MWAALRQGHGHECSPAMTVEEHFSTGPPFERPVFDAIIVVPAKMVNFVVA